MSAPRHLKNDIIFLRKEGKTYREIQQILNCSKGSINYNCKRADLTDIGLKIPTITEETKIEIAKFCKTNTNKSASSHFGLCLSSIKKYKNYQPQE